MTQELDRENLNPTADAEHESNYPDGYSIEEERKFDGAPPPNPDDLVDTYREESKDEGDPKEDPEIFWKFTLRFNLFMSQQALSESDYASSPSNQAIHEKIKAYLASLTPDALTMLLDQYFEKMGGKLRRKVFDGYVLMAASAGDFGGIARVLLEKKGEEAFNINNPEDVRVMQRSFLLSIGRGLEVLSVFSQYGMKLSDPGMAEMLVTMGEVAPLIAVVKHKCPLEIVRQLFPMSAEVLNTQEDNKSSSNQETALMYAAMEDNVELVQLLLEQGADTKLKDRFGRTALMLALRGGHSRVAALLLAQNPDLAQERPRLRGVNVGETAFSFSVKGGCDAEIVRQLLPKNIEEMSAYHHPLLGEDGSPLGVAAENGHVHLVQLFLSLNVNIEATNIMGETPLIRALQRGHSDVALLLLERGADPTPRIGGTGLLLAVKGGCDERVISILLSRRTPDQTEKSQALLAAAEKKNPKIVELLLDAGADIEAKDRQERTPLLCASGRSSEVANLLLSRGANPHYQNQNGETALTCAAEVGNALIVERLLRSSVPVDTPQYDGQTGLMLAARGDHVETARLLLDANADLTPRSSSDDKTALMIAIAENHPGIVELLLKRGNVLEKDRAQIEEEFKKLLEWVADCIDQNRKIGLDFFDKGEDISEVRTAEFAKKNALKILSLLLQKGIVPQCMRVSHHFKRKEVTTEFLAPFHQMVLAYFQTLEEVLENPPAEMLPPLARLTVEYMLPAAPSAEADEHKAGQEEASAHSPVDEALESEMARSLAVPGVHLHPAPRPGTPSLPTQSVGSSQGANREETFNYPG